MALNKYMAYYKGKSIDVEAETSYEAQQIAAKKLRVRAAIRYMVSVYLIEKGSDDGERTHVSHSTQFV